MTKQWHKLTLAELEALPTLAIGQADDLKLESRFLRLWLSRMGDNKVTLEHYFQNKWQTWRHWYVS